MIPLPTLDHLHLDHQSRAETMTNTKAQRRNLHVRSAGLAHRL